MRVAAAHIYPELTIEQAAAVPIALFRSESPKTMRGPLPPSSKVTLFIDLAALS